MPPKRRHQYDMLVIGGGVAGLTAAAHASSYGLSAVILEGSGLYGGQVATVTAVEGFLAGATPSGADIASGLLESIRSGGSEVIEESVTSVEVTGRNFRVMTSAGQALGARSVVMATGAHLRELDAAAASSFIGRGISHCASCDGPLYSGEDVIVIGGGDSALQEAAVLAGMCKSVRLAVRGNLKARRSYIKRLQKHANIELLWDCVVEEVLGDTSGVTGVRLRYLEYGTTQDIVSRAVFPYLGTKPNSGLVDGLVEIDDAGRVGVDPSFATSVPGIYAIGAVRQNFSGELASAAGEGAGVAKTIATTLE